MPALRDLVDVEAVLVTHLSNDVTLAGHVGGPGTAAKVSTELPKTFPTAGEKRVQLNRATSSQIDPDTNHLERAVIDFKAFGASKAQAWDVVAALWSAVQRARTTAHTGAVVTRLERLTGPSWSPDPSTNAPRYTLSVAVTVHPTATA